MNYTTSGEDTLSVFLSLPPLLLVPTSIHPSISKHFSVSFSFHSRQLLYFLRTVPTLGYSSHSGVWHWFIRFFRGMLKDVFISVCFHFILSIHWLAPSAFILLYFRLLGMHHCLHLPSSPNLNDQFQLNYLHFKLFISGSHFVTPSRDIPPLAISKALHWISFCSTSPPISIIFTFIFFFSRILLWNCNNSQHICKKFKLKQWTRAYWITTFWKWSKKKRDLLFYPPQLFYRWRHPQDWCGFVVWVSLSVYCVSEFKCADLRVVNSRTRTSHRRTRGMGEWRRRQRTELWTAFIVYGQVVYVRALTFDQWLRCDPSWITADKQVCARTHTDLFSAAMPQSCAHSSRTALFKRNNTGVTVRGLTKRTHIGLRITTHSKQAFPSRKSMENGVHQSCRY